MLKSKYSKPIIIYIFYCIFIIILSILLSRYIPGFNLTYFLPISDIGIEIGLIFIVILPLSSILGVLVGGYILAPIFLFIHKRIFGSKVEYGIYNKEFEGFKFFSEGLFAALMTINLSLLLTTPTIISLSVGSDSSSFIDDLTTFLALLMLTIGIASLLFSSTWFLMDSGILYSNLKKGKDTNKPAEIRSIGRWYGQFLKGYAGVSVILSYIDFLNLFVPQLAKDLSLAIFIMLLIVFIPLPLVMIIPIIPAFIISDQLKGHRIRYIRKKASKLGITSKAEVNFELKN